MRLVKTLVLGSLLAAAGSGLYAQTQTTPATKPAAKAAAPKPQRPKRCTQDCAAKKPAKTATSSTPAEPAEMKVARRDPFESLTSRQEAKRQRTRQFASGQSRITSRIVAAGRHRAFAKRDDRRGNKSASAYLFSARRATSCMTEAWKRLGWTPCRSMKLGKDAFGKPVERQVNKRLYSSAGEQQ